MTDTPPPSRQPIFNIPPVTKALLAVNVAIHLLRQLLPDAVDDQLLAIFGVLPARYLQAPETTGLASWPVWIEPVSYQFLHAGWVHLGVNMLSLVAFGSGVEQRLGRARYLVFYLICGVLAAATELVVDGAEVSLLIGASGAISGLFGAILRFQMRDWRQLLPVATLWLALNVITGSQGMMIGTDIVPIAWIAHIGGFVAGLALFPLLARRRIGMAGPNSGQGA